MKLVWFGVALYVGLVLTLFPKWTVDDAYITFRYARNFADSGELTWNPGHHPIEGYTGIALVLLIAGTTKLGMSPVVATQAIGTAGFVLGGLVLLGFLRRLDVAKPVTATVLLLYFTAPFFIPNALSGLETNLFATVVLSSLYAFYMCLIGPSRQPSRELGLFGLLLLAGLVRPEGALLGGLVLMGLAVATFRGSPAGVRPLLARALIAFVLPGLAYFLWRWSYYGLLLPNTFYAKTLGTGLWGLERATVWDLERFLELYALVPLVGAGLWVLVEANEAWRHLRDRGKSGALLQLGLVGGVFMTICTLQYARTALEMNFSYRFFLPFFPMLLVAVGILASAGYEAVVRTRSERPLRFRVLQGLTLLLIVAQLTLYARGVLGELEYVSWYKQMLEDEHVAAGKFIKQHVPRDEWLVVLYDAGAAPYYSGLPTVDFGALNDPTVVRLRRSGATAELVDYFFSFRPGVAMFTSSDPEQVKHANKLSAAIVDDERFAQYALAKRFSSEGRKYHQLVFLRKDLMFRPRLSGATGGLTVEPADAAGRLSRLVAGMPA